MNLLHAAERQPIEKSAWIKTVVVAVDVDVVDVEQYAASRLGHDRGQELPLAEFIAVKTQVARHVLEQELPAERVLHLAHAARDMSDSLDRVRQRHQRSEEHTSELQSLMRISYAVFCLKKNKKEH